MFNFQQVQQKYDELAARLEKLENDFRKFIAQLPEELEPKGE